MTNDPAIIDEMLHKAKTIAVLGMSDKPSRASYHIGKYLAEHGYRVFPVNPMLTQIEGQTCYPDLAAAQAAAREQAGAGPNDPGPGHSAIDLVDVFRASDNVPPIVDDVVCLGIPYLWLQDGVIHEEAVARARAAGVKVIQNDCIYREHAKRSGLHP
ncbi:MAG TPA: CoA-binding protein [Terracidiphilus sp.]|jgi:hypothetical protein